MPRIALQITPDLVEGICQMSNVENYDVFGDSSYAVVEFIGPREINIKLLSDDEIFKLAKTDSDLQIVTL